MAKVGHQGGMSMRVGIAAQRPQASTPPLCCFWLEGPHRTPTPHFPSVVPSAYLHGRSRYAKLSIHDDSKVKIAPVHSDFLCDFGPLSLMGFAG